MITDTVKRKIKFVNDISTVVVPVQKNVESIQYRVFENLDHSSVVAECLVVIYKGGARTVRNCNGNSFSAIFSEIAKFLDHGYYDEERDLLNIEAHPETWKEYKEE